MAARGLSAREAGAVLVVWPESSVGYAALSDSQSVQLLQDLVDRTGVTLLTGSVLDDTVQTTGLRNRGMLWQPGRGVTHTYDKQHLVPFGEFVPLRDIARKVSPQVDMVARDFVAGSQPGVFPLPGGSTRTFGDVICFEVAYDASVRELARVGFIVNQTNNATYLGTGQPEQQFRMAQVRAAEMGKYVLVAATSGVSGVVDGRGHVVNDSVVRTNTPRAQWVRVGLNSKPPVSSLTGPVIQWLCAAAVLLMVLPRRRRRVN
ncbi:MAG: apolipoprotein N-acyltransferase [Actinobacteria bacterium]|nr:apolipoprotein N-acyltransferase [Actinomycetota bacterium]